MVYNNQYNREYYAKNKEKVLASAKRYRKRNLAKMVEMNRQWRKKNPEVWAEIHARNYSKFSLKRDAERTAHPELWQRSGKSGRWRKIQPPLTPGQLAIKNWRKKEKSKEAWRRAKANPILLQKHRVIAMNYWRRRQLEKARLKLIYLLVHRINQDRINKEKLRLLERGDNYAR